MLFNYIKNEFRESLKNQKSSLSTRNEYSTGILAGQQFVPLLILLFLVQLFQKLWLLELEFRNTSFVDKNGGCPVGINHDKIEVF